MPKIVEKLWTAEHNIPLYKGRQVMHVVGRHCDGFLLEARRSLVCGAGAGVE